jgi:CheY-like chemotaxis protein
MQKKALVVDNDFFFVEFLSELLSKRGYQVFKAYNGKQGIAELEDKTVDIIFADLILQKVDGRQFFKFVRDKFNVNFHSRLIGATVSTIKMQDNIVGWVVVLAPTLLNDSNETSG